MTEEPNVNADEQTSPVPVERIVIRDVAIADAKYVLQWLLQLDEIRGDLGYVIRVPENIVGLCKSALERFDAALQADADDADPIAMSETEIDDLVRKVCG